MTNTFNVIKVSLKGKRKQENKYQSDRMWERLHWPLKVYFLKEKMINPNLKMIAIPDLESGGWDSKGPSSWFTVSFISILKLCDEFIGINVTIIVPIFYTEFGKFSGGHRTGEVFIPIPKKGNAKECSHYHIIAFISHASKVMFKILQAYFFNSRWTESFQMFKLDLEKAEEPEIKLPASVGS